MESTTIFWLTAMLVLFVIEAVTVNLVTIWFALGSLAALIVSLLHGSLTLQLILFAAVTALTLIATRPLTKKLLDKKHFHPTNADSVIGKSCIVTQTIDNTAATGEVKCQGQAWSARSVDGECIEVGTIVTPVAIEGVKLIVKKSYIKGE